MDINSLYIQKQIDETTIWQPVDDLIKYNIKCEKILDNNNDKYKFDLYIDYINQFETYVTYIKLIDYIDNKNKDKIKLFISDNTNYLKIICDEKNIMILNKKKIIFEPHTLIKYCSFDYTFRHMLINGKRVLSYYTHDCNKNTMQVHKHFYCCKVLHVNCKNCVNNIHYEMNEPGFMDYIMENKKVIDDFNEFFILHKKCKTTWGVANISYANNTANFKNYIFLQFITQYDWYKIFVLYLNYLNSKYNIRYIISCPILGQGSDYKFNHFTYSFQITITDDTVPVFKEYKYVSCESTGMYSYEQSLNDAYDAHDEINKTNTNVEIICILMPMLNNQNIIIYRHDINI